MEFFLIAIAACFLFDVEAPACLAFLVGALIGKALI
jgi:uncharacterized OsmC-like protein